MDLQTLLTAQPDIPLWLLGIVLAWSLAWKGAALWKAAKNNSPIWFVALLVINTVGILEILYIFLFSKISLPEVHEQKPIKTIEKKAVQKKPGAKRKRS